MDREDVNRVRNTPKAHKGFPSMSSSSDYALQERLRSDRQLFYILLAHVPVVALLVPLEFETGAFSAFAAVILGCVLAGGYSVLRGTRACSVLFAAGLMAWSAIMIQSQMGRIEMHFHIFSALALVIIYRDWLPVVTAALIIAVHHLVFTALQQSGATLGNMPIVVFDHEATFGMAFLHAAFVVFEAGILVFFALRMQQERDQAYQIIEVVRKFGAEKDLSGRLDGRGDPVTAESFNSMMQQFSMLIGQVRQLSGQLQESADELSAVSDHSSGLASELRRQTEQAAAATTELAATVQEVAQNAQAATDSVSIAASSATQGSENVQHTVELTDDTHRALEESAHLVSDLVAKVQSIEAFISSINEISDQTNLLALNAAIEAARAGDHGRGFSVVAEEVRSLSRRTQDFTGEIRSTIDELSSVADATFKAIREGQARSGETTESVRRAGEAIGRITTSVSEVFEMNRQIAAAAEEQAVTSVQIDESVQVVAEQNSEVELEAQRTRSMAQKLERMIKDVDGLVSGYRGLD